MIDDSKNEVIIIISSRLKLTNILLFNSTLIKYFYCVRQICFILYSLFCLLLTIIFSDQKNPKSCSNIMEMILFLWKQALKRKDIQELHRNLKEDLIPTRIL